MKNREAALRRYCRRVRANLPCGWKQKRKIMEEFKACVDAYVKENPEWDLPQLEAELGSAQQIAGTYVDNLETKELLRSLLVRSGLWRWRRSLCLRWWRCRAASWDTSFGTTIITRMGISWKLHMRCPWMYRMSMALSKSPKKQSPPRSMALSKSPLM